MKNLICIGMLLFFATPVFSELSDSDLQRIREVVPDDFLILCGTNYRKLALSAPYINGCFMETFYLQ